MSIKTKITVTPNTILLQIPESDSRRAGKVEGGQWDESAGVWVYPYDEQTLEKLIQEFGEQLDDLKFDASGGFGDSRPDSIDAEGTDVDGDEGEEKPPLEHEHPEFEQVVAILEAMREKLERVPTVEFVKTVVDNGIENVYANTEEVKERVTDLLEMESSDQTLEAALKRLEKDLASERAEKSRLKKDLEAMKERESEFEGEITKRQGDVAKARREKERIKKTLVPNTILDLAKELSGNDEDFSAILETVDIDLFEHIPLLLVEKARGRLARIVAKNCDGPTQCGRAPHEMDLWELLREPCVRDIFESHEENAAHFLRFRRKTVAHPIDRKSRAVVSKTEMYAQSIAAVIAAAIVWKKMSPAVP